jgi:hypothetical protein
MFRILAVAVVSIVTATATKAQNASQAPAQSNDSAKQRNTRSKTHKVWTDDDVSTLRTPADIHLEQEQRQADAAASAANQAAAEKQATPAPDKKPGSSKAESSTRPPLLSNPKTVDDADAMLAWEGRDLRDQSEFIDGLKDRIDQTSDPGEKARLTKTLEERQGVLATIKKEIGELQAERKALQNKSASGATAANTQP